MDSYAKSVLGCFVKDTAFTSGYYAMVKSNLKRWELSEPNRQVTRKLRRVRPIVYRLVISPLFLNYNVFTIRSIAFTSTWCYGRISISIHEVKTYFDALSTLFCRYFKWGWNKTLVWVKSTQIDWDASPVYSLGEHYIREHDVFFSFFT